MGSDAALAVRDLTFAYGRSTEELFGGLTHQFTPGAVTAVTGPSGRGKSTLLYVLGLMLRPRRGEVLFGGTRVDDRSDAHRSAVRAHRLGFVFQDAVLDPTRTVLDSVVEPALYAGKRAADVHTRARALLDELGVGARADHRPGEISGGQAQRVAIARALLVDPPVILADEPTGNLHSVQAREIMELFKDLNRAGTTIIQVTHSEANAAYGDRVVELQDGWIVRQSAKGMPLPRRMAMW